METTETRNNLPAQLSTFIGREREIADIRRTLTEAHAARQGVAGFSAPLPRLLTLAGVGGRGKTRLALQVATAVLSEYPDGVWLVELAALVDPRHVPKAVAIALGISERPGESLEATLVEWLTTRRLLLVLDNCEHLISATAHVSETLLRSCPSLQILATSREPLHIPGELIWRVPPLSTPDPRQLTDLLALREYESVRLFEERAMAVSPAFDLKRQNAAVVAHLCHYLAGILLALELAAARISVLSEGRYESHGTAEDRPLMTPPSRCFRARVAGAPLSRPSSSTVLNMSRPGPAMFGGNRGSQSSDYCP